MNGITLTRLIIQHMVILYAHPPGTRSPKCAISRTWSRYARASNIVIELWRERVVTHLLCSGNFKTNKKHKQDKGDF